MSISYSAIISKPKVTLPSVESWGTNMNILREPSKSVHTRRKDKVSDILFSQVVQDGTIMGGDRLAENILVYGRGLNVTKVYGPDKDRPKQTYRLETNGAFRPPILRQEQLMPLSRQSRNWTDQFTNPGFTDYSHKLSCKAEKRTIRDNVLHSEVQPNAVYKTNFVTREPYKVKHVISNPIIAKDISSNFKYMDITNKQNKTPQHAIKEDYNTTMANTNMSSNITKPLQNTFDTNPYIQNKAMAKDVSSGIYKSNGKLSLPSYTIPLQRNKPVAEGYTNISQRNLTNIIPHSNTIKLDRTTPLTQGQTNICQTNDAFINTNRTVQLPTTLNKGGYFQRGAVPTYEQYQNTQPKLESNILKLRKKAHQTQLQR